MSEQKEDPDFWLHDAASILRENGSAEHAKHVAWAADEIGRLRETLTFPILTPDAPVALFMQVLEAHEKGLPVNIQDLVNALVWRIHGQRRELGRLNDLVRALRRETRGGD